MAEWWREHDTLIWVLGVLSVVTFIGTLIVVPILVARMPADYFLHRRPVPGGWSQAHPALRVAGLVLKNLVGALFLVAGLAMLVLPGQGILTILIGMSLLGFPGKRRLELRLVSIPAVHRSVDWIRRRAGREPIQLPEKGSSEIR